MVKRLRQVEGHMRYTDYTKYKIRTCQTMHQCAVCKNKISYGEQYHDGGDMRRAHVRCAEEHKKQIWQEQNQR